jgi:hypothetical protein
MAVAVFNCLHGGLVMDVCFDVVGCSRLRVRWRVPVFMVVVAVVVDVDNVDEVATVDFDVCVDNWGGHKCTTQ